jgi:hypothetical protein
VHRLTEWLCSGAKLLQHPVVLICSCCHLAYSTYDDGEFKHMLQLLSLGAALKAEY